MPILENHPYDELQVGTHATLRRRLTQRDLELFAALSGDRNPTHLDADYAEGTPFRGIVAHGMWGGLLISRMLGSDLPGPGTVYISQTLEFDRPVRPHDELEVLLEVSEKLPHGRVRLRCEIRNQLGELVTRGSALVIAPKTKQRVETAELPELVTRDHDLYENLLERVRPRPPIRVAVVHPCSVEAMAAVFEAMAEGLIEPVLVGPRGRIERAAAELGKSIEGMQHVAAEHSLASALAAAHLAREGKVQVLMKGSLHTDELLGAVVAKDTGLRTARRLSHCYVIAVPGRLRPLLVTDAAVNIAPDLLQKADIAQNAIDLARLIDIELPRVAILAAVEVVNPAMPATLEAAALCKMAERGQITGGLLDGPLAYDNATDVEAARIKGLQGEVAGRADVLLVPDLESGNMLVKQLTFTSDADAAGIVLGAKVPIVLTSRADSLRIRLASCALAKAVVHRIPQFPGAFGGPRHES